MLTLPITAREVESRSLTPEHLNAAVEAVNTDGLVVLENIVSLDHLDILHEKLLADIAALQARKDAPYNWNQGNIQQDPPPFPPYLFHDVLVNDLVIQVTKGVLGPGVKNHFYSGNTAVQSEQRQPVHADTGHLWTNLKVAHPAFQLVVNIPTVDMSAENGSTEIWPGTHLDTTVSYHEDIKVPEEILAKRREIMPPIQPNIKRGSVLIRDIRLWHAGMPNRTPNPRPMMAMIHACSWLGTGRPLRFPKGTESFFNHSDLRTAARFVDGPIDYINTPHAYEYSADNEEED